MTDPLPLSTIIDRCLPGAERIPLRVALLRVGHAAQAADRATDQVGAALAGYLQAPDDADARAYLWRLLVESDALASELTALAQEIRKSRTTLKSEIGLQTA